MNKTLIAAALVAAFTLVGTTPSHAFESSVEQAAPHRGWSDWRLVDWHGRPKALIGEDPRTLREKAAVRADDRFTGRTHLAPGES